MRDKTEKRSAAVKGLNLVIIVLCITLISGIFYAVRMFHEDYRDVYSEQSWYYRLADGNYSDLVDWYYYESVYPKKSSEDRQEYYNAARYFEAASLYKAYCEGGDTVRAEREMQKMEAALAGMGYLAGEADIIRQKLGID